MQEKLLYAMAQLDQKTCDKICGMEERLRSLGIDVKAPLKVPYHITLGAFPLDQEEKVSKLVEETCKKASRFSLEYAYIGLFGLNVLFLGPNVNRELLALEQPFAGVRLKQHEWTAHTTLVMDDQEVILKALPIAAQEFKGFRAEVASVSLYEYWPSRRICECNLKQP